MEAYRYPMEWGKSIWSSLRILFPSPLKKLVHAISPLPSTMRIAASSNGETKNALAACEIWWLT